MNKYATMRRTIFTIAVMLTTAVSANAMSYEQARDEALFLTDKMAYELNLTDEQYDAAYEINLDYLMGVATVDDVYGPYWERRNLDFGYILLDWQWEAYLAATYFYRPLYFAAGLWHFAIYSHYPRRDYFYFHRPSVYASYRGGHSWNRNGGRSYYQSRTNAFHGTTNHSGMRDQWDQGTYNRSQSINRAGTSSTQRTARQGATSRQGTSTRRGTTMHQGTSSSRTTTQSKATPSTVRSSRSSSSSTSARSTSGSSVKQTTVQRSSSTVTNKAGSATSSGTRSGGTSKSGVSTRSGGSSSKGGGGSRR